MREVGSPTLSNAGTVTSSSDRSGIGGRIAMSEYEHTYGDGVTSARNAKVISLT